MRVDWLGCHHLQSLQTYGWGELDLVGPHSGYFPGKQHFYLYVSNMSVITRLGYDGSDGGVLVLVVVCQCKCLLYSHVGGSCYNMRLEGREGGEVIQYGCQSPHNHTESRPDSGPAFYVRDNNFIYLYGPGALDSSIST